MYDLFSKHKYDSNCIHSFIQPFDRTYFYRRVCDDTALPILSVSFSEALQKLIQLYLHPDDASYGGIVCKKNYSVCRLPVSISDDFPPSLFSAYSNADYFFISYDAISGMFCCGTEGRSGMLPYVLDDLKDGKKWPSTPAPMIAALITYGLGVGIFTDTFQLIMDDVNNYRSAESTSSNSDPYASDIWLHSCSLYSQLLGAVFCEDPVLPVYIEKKVFPVPHLNPREDEDTLLSVGADAYPPSKTSYSLFDDIPSLKDAFRISTDRVFSEEEQAMIPVIPLEYQVPPQLLLAARAIKETHSDSVPFRNIMFRGNAGTGKTEAAKMLAYACGLPYTFMTCSADTEIYDLLVQVIPCSSKNSDASGFTIVDSPLVKAIEKGYLIEIQEPAVIMKPGVLAGLNAIWDSCGMVRLMDGRVIKRHKDCIIVLTTNSSYEGCKRLNQSVISRQQLIVDFDLPDDESLCERISVSSGFSSPEVIDSMLKVKHAVDDILAQNAASDGDTGIRPLINWATLTRITGDPYVSGLNTFISCATSDPELRTELLAALESQFSPSSSRSKYSYE